MRQIRLHPENKTIRCISLTKLKEVARAATAVRKIDRLVLIDIEKLDAFIDTFEP